MLHHCTITYCTIAQLQHALHGPVGSRIPFACPHTLASKVPQDTDPRFSIFCVMMINWCDTYQNGWKHLFWNASASLAPNLLDKFVGYISSYIAALESKWPTHNGSCHVALLYLADIIACRLRRDIIVGLETLLVQCDNGGPPRDGPPNARVSPPEISVSIASFPAYLALSSNWQNFPLLLLFYHLM